MDLSIIIISYNTKDITKKCLETVFESLSHDKNLRAEIIVLDNNSTDGSVEILKKIQSSELKTQNNNLKFKTLEKRENLGFAKGNNEAVKHASGNVILFLNSDIEVLKDAIPKLYKRFVNQNDFAFVGGKLLERDGKTPQPSAGPFYSLPVVFGALFLRGDYWGLTRYSPDKIVGVDWVSGACIMTQKDTFERLGGFDEAIFMYMEEIDLLFRAQKKRLKTGFYPEAQFIHLGTASSANRKQPILQVYKGFLYFYKKHHYGLQYRLLRYMLQLKALSAGFIGRVIGNKYLIQTYGEAEKIVASDR